MQTLENLERKFLSIIPIKPFELGDVRATTDSDKQLTVEQAKQDIAIADTRKIKDKVCR